MTTTTFSAGTVVASTWLNDINDHVYEGKDFAGITPINVKDPAYGAIGNGVADDTAAIRAAILAVPRAGQLYFPRGKYKISDELRITTPMLISGDGPGEPFEGVTLSEQGSYIVQTNTSKRAFTLVPALANYAFSQYGICGVHFQDLTVQGASGSLILACVGADTTVNAGDFHIRGNSFTRCNFRYAVDALNLTGIAYLNHAYQCNFMFSTTGVKIARGAASDGGGQTRFFGCQMGFNTVGVSLNEDTVVGDFAFFGCTIADNTTYGISTNDEVSISTFGTNFEANTLAGIYIRIPVTKVNPNSSHFREITGNTFGSNGASIWVDKLTTAGNDGNFNFACSINSNTFNDALAIKLTVPGVEPGFCSTAFVIGASNTGTTAGTGELASSQVSSKFYGSWEKRRFYTKRFSFGSGSYVSGNIIDMLPIGLVPTSVRIYLTANSSGFSNFMLGDISNSSRYVNIADASIQALNTWVSWTPTVPQFIVAAANNQFRLIGTGGILGAAGVIEVQGYVT